MIILPLSLNEFGETEKMWFVVSVRSQLDRFETEQKFSMSTTQCYKDSLTVSSRENIGREWSVGENIVTVWLL